MKEKPTDTDSKLWQTLDHSFQEVEPSPQFEAKVLARIASSRTGKFHFFSQWRRVLAVACIIFMGAISIHLFQDHEYRLQEQQIAGNYEFLQEMEVVENLEFLSFLEQVTPALEQAESEGLAYEDELSFGD